MNDTNTNKRYMDFAPKRQGGRVGVRRPVATTMVEERASMVAEGSNDSAVPVRVVRRKRATTESSGLGHQRTTIKTPKRTKIKVKLPETDVEAPVTRKRKIAVFGAVENEGALSQPPRRSRVATVAHRTEDAEDGGRRLMTRDGMSAKKKVIVPPMTRTALSTVADDGYVDDDDDIDELLGVIEDLDEDFKSNSITSSKVATPGMAKARKLWLGKNKRNKLEDDRVGFVDGKSPFINVDKLEKRPLSALRRANVNEQPSQRNSFAEQAKVASAQSDVPTMVVTKASKKSSLSLIIAIILTMLLGGAVGFVTYLAFFQ